MRAIFSVFCQNDAEKDWPENVSSMHRVTACGEAD